ncbi:MAG: hypothetical protein R3D55_02325 [Chloroflexota bacterium]
MGIAPQLTWETGTAYDLFTSLDVVHNPARYGLRGSWAAGVRSRLPVEQREFLQNSVEGHHLWMIPWLANQPGPKDSATILQSLAAIPPEQRLQEIVACYMADEMRALLFGVAAAGEWRPEDKEALRELYTQMQREERGKGKRISDEELESRLAVWADTAVYSQNLLDALNVYYDVPLRKKRRASKNR